MLLRSQRCRRKAYRALRTTPVFVLALLLFLQFLQYSFSSLIFIDPPSPRLRRGRQLPAKKFLQFIEHTVPALFVIVAGRFAWKFFVSQADLRAPLTIEEFHRDDT